MVEQNRLFADKEAKYKDQIMEIERQRAQEVAKLQGELQAMKIMSEPNNKAAETASSEQGDDIQFLAEVKPTAQVQEAMQVLMKKQQEHKLNLNLMTQ